jgi:hypothetical protein
MNYLHLINRSRLSIAIAVFFLTGLGVQAQKSEKNILNRFELEIGGGLAIPSGLKEPGLDLGFLLSIEPRYVASSSIKLGLKVEAVSLVRNIRSSGEGFRSDYMEQNGYMFTFDYLGKKKQIQQYFGLGAGIQNVISDDLDPFTPNVQAVEKATYSFMMRSGIEFAQNKLRGGIEYNIVGAVAFNKPNHFLSFKFAIILFTKKRQKL